MFSRIDRNRSGVLEEDEWRDSRFAQGADRNGDGKVTKDELTARMAEYSGRRSRESDRDSSDSEDSGDSDSGNSNGRRSYRFLTAAELLPSGLPDWFASYDVNGDGQVAMVEYSSDWSASKARDFDRYDLNHDGLITPRECLNAPSATDVLADVGDGPSTAGDQPSGGDEKASADSEGAGGGAWWLQ